MIILSRAELDCRMSIEGKTKATQPLTFVVGPLIIELAPFGSINLLLLSNSN